jgi:hemoglobin
MAKFNTITKENINEMVFAFYAKFLSEINSVSNIFKEALGEDIKSEKWQTHIETLTKFWAMMTLNENEYKGSPLAPHFDLPLTKEMFHEWLGMFFELIDSMNEDETAIIFKTKAEDIAKNFMGVLSIH